MPDDQGPNMEMRAFIAVVLSLAVMLGYQYFFAPSPPQPGSNPPIELPTDTTPGAENPEVPAAGDEQPQAAPADTAGAGEPAQALGGSGTGTVAETATPAVVAAEERRQVTIETERYELIVDNRGALVTSAVLRDYQSDFNGPLQLVVDDLGRRPAGLLALASPQDPALAQRANQALYRLTIDGREPGARYRVDDLAEIRWQWADGNGWVVDKRLTVSRDGYINLVSIAVESPGPSPIFVTVGPGLEVGADNSRAGIYLTKGAVYFDGSDVTHISGDDIEEEEIRPLDVIWGGIESNYFVALFAPQMRTSLLIDAVAAPDAEPEEGAETAEPSAEQPGGPGTRTELGVLVPPGQALEMPLFLGPKAYDLLENAGYGLERAVDYGMFAILAHPVAITLEWLSELTGNYGLAIIMATLGVRLLFFPLSQSSMKSMRKMQQLQPQMNAIRAKYKGVKDLEKRQEMNSEVMQLYKDHGVSPLGGCLPMLLQMPVLFAFYAAISVSIASRQAPLGLWIQDLSKMDPYYVLPLLMGASMYAQQRMSPSTGDPMQQRIFRLMPVMFTFFFLTFPSGLVIYWLVNTVLGIGQQTYVNHQLGAPDAKATSGPKGKSKKSGKGQKKGGGAKRKKRGK